MDEVVLSFLLLVGLDQDRLRQKPLEVALFCYQLLQLSEWGFPPSYERLSFLQDSAFPVLVVGTSIFLFESYKISQESAVLMNKDTQRSERFPCVEREGLSFPSLELVVFSYCAVLAVIYRCSIALANQASLMQFRFDSTRTISMSLTLQRSQVVFSLPGLECFYLQVSPSLLFCQWNKAFPSPSHPGWESVKQGRQQISDNRSISVQRLTQRVYSSTWTRVPQGSET